MVTEATRTLDFSAFPASDGEPMAETIENQNQMIGLMFSCRNLLRIQGRERVAVGGNQFLYYNQRDGRDHCSPDVYVALDVPPGLRPTWKTWVEGKCPDIVFEISSPSTADVDLERKPVLYGRLGAREYYIYDPQLEMVPVFVGLRYVDGRPEPMPVLPSGGIYSPLLMTELRPIDGYVRVIDPRSGEPFKWAEEVQADFEAAQMLLANEAEARLAIEQQLADQEQAHRALEQRLAGEAEARRTAEERAAQAEAALRALQAERGGNSPA